jgi:hypothetical protein
MIKKIGVYLVMLMTISLMLNVDLYAQSRIRFARGRSSATVSGTIPARSNRSFIVGASYGQTARVSVSPGNLQVWAAGTPKGESGGTTFDTEAGDNEFGIYNPSNRAVRYTLTISIR